MQKNLSDLFNADPQRKEQLSLIETALLILAEQKAASHEDRSMHGEIAETRRYIWEWGGDAGDGKVPHPNEPNPRAADIAQHQRILQQLQGGLVDRIAQSESKLTAVVDKIFGGDGKKIKEFYGPPLDWKGVKGAKWIFRATQSYKHPEGTNVKRFSAVTAVALKFASPALVEKQTAQLNAMIDEGKFTNKAKRVAWQLSRFGAAV